MKERPILFSAPMVRAILEDRKSQTRRIVEMQPRTKADIGTHGVGMPFIRNQDPMKRNLMCPYGQPGDRLWVREAWKTHSTFDHLPPREVPRSNLFYAADERYSPSGSRWRPSIHMPRWASRILLEITGVRVERLNAISEADALAEGYSATPVTWDDAVEGAEPVHDDPRYAFSALWDSINGSGSWATNPWVWAIEFRRLETAA
jgi:hypothetical protein